MPRPATHTADTFIDAAVRLFAEGGARAVTMSAVAAASGAPSGSIYHRFADRPALLAAVWRRTARGFEAVVGERFGVDPTPEDAPGVAAFCVDWCRRHPDETAVVLAGKRAFSPATWSAAEQAQQEREESARDGAIAAAIRAIAAKCDCPGDEIAFAVFDVPIAVVRRYAVGGRPIPVSAVDLARRLAATIVG